LAVLNYRRINMLRAIGLGSASTQEERGSHAESNHRSQRNDAGGDHP